MSFRVALVAFIVAVLVLGLALGRCGGKTLCDEIKDAHGCPSPAVTR